jgi:NAD(P)-dependent dehydrogenase (short-subunit alcohol dehydrogenase family)
MTAAVHLAPAMAEAGGGTIVITGGMPEPDPEVTSLSLGKAGVRALTKLLASEYGPAGIHVATVTVGGAVAPGGPYEAGSRKTRRRAMSSTGGGQPAEDGQPS